MVLPAALRRSNRALREFDYCLQMTRGSGLRECGVREVELTHREMRRLRALHSPFLLEGGKGLGGGREEKGEELLAQLYS